MQLKLTVSHWSFTFISGFVPPFTPFPGFWSRDLFLCMDKRDERLDLCNLCDRKSIRDTCAGKILSNLWLSQDSLKPWHRWPKQNFNLLSLEKRYFLSPRSSLRIWVLSIYLFMIRLCQVLKGLVMVSCYFFSLITDFWRHFPGSHWTTPDDHNGSLCRRSYLGPGRVNRIDYMREKKHLRRCWKCLPVHNGLFCGLQMRNDRCGQSSMLWGE